MDAFPDLQSAHAPMFVCTNPVMRSLSKQPLPLAAAYTLNAATPLPIPTIGTLVTVLVDPNQCGGDGYVSGQWISDQAGAIAIPLAAAAAP